MLGTRVLVSCCLPSRCARPWEDQVPSEPQFPHLQRQWMDPGRDGFLPVQTRQSPCFSRDALTVPGKITCTAGQTT